MLIREVLAEEKEAFNQLAPHPVQSWEWGEFRQKTGLKVTRFGVFEGKKLVSGFQTITHSIPRTNYTLIVCSRGPMPDEAMLETLRKQGRQENAILVKLEPQVCSPWKEVSGAGFQQIKDFLLLHGCQEGKPFFPKWTFYLDLKKTEEELLNMMHPKTRYNLRLAQKHGVTVSEDNSQESFETYLRLLFKTTERQVFYAHDENYHRILWRVLQPAGIAHLLVARYQGKILATWLLFVLNKVLYYPYGGSSREHKEVMPNHLIMWEAIRFGQKIGCQTFDLWGAPGPNPKPSNPWFGFYRFKMGFNPQLMEFVGTYDLIINPYLYPLYNFADSLRWFLLKARSRLLP